MAFGLRLALGAALLLLGTAAQAAAPQASVTAPRTSCAAPCAIFFDARGSSDADLSRDAEFADLIYSWDFGDPDSGDWEQGARAGTGTPHSRNVDTGFVAGHVYENPGTYTATLTVSDGTSSDTDSIVVQIQDPNTVWPGSNTVCISSSGMPSAGAGGCPSGAATVQTSDYDQAMFSNNCNSAARRCLFKRGDQFTGSTTVTMTSSGPTLIGAYGSGAKPRNQPVVRFGSLPLRPGQQRHPCRRPRALGRERRRPRRRHRARDPLDQRAAAPDARPAARHPPFRPRGPFPGAEPVLHPRREHPHRGRDRRLDRPRRPRNGRQRRLRDVGEEPLSRQPGRRQVRRGERPRRAHAAGQVLARSRVRAQLARAPERQRRPDRPAARSARS